MDCLFVTHFTGGPAVPGAARRKEQASKSAMAGQLRLSVLPGQAVTTAPEHDSQTVVLLSCGTRRGEMAGDRPPNQTGPETIAKVLLR